MRRSVAAEAMRAYTEETNRLTASGARTAMPGRPELAKVESDRPIIEAIEDGMYQPRMKEKMPALEARKAELERAACRRHAATCPMLHPGMAEHLSPKVGDLAEALNDREEPRRGGGDRCAC